MHINDWLENISSLLRWVIKSYEPNCFLNIICISNNQTRSCSAVDHKLSSNGGDRFLCQFKHRECFGGQFACRQIFYCLRFCVTLSSFVDYFVSHLFQLLECVFYFCIENLILYLTVNMALHEILLEYFLYRSGTWLFCSWVSRHISINSLFNVFCHFFELFYCMQNKSLWLLLRNVWYWEFFLELWLESTIFSERKIIQFCSKFRLFLVVILILSLNYYFLIWWLMRLKSRNLDNSTLLHKVQLQPMKMCLLFINFVIKLFASATLLFNSQIECISWTIALIFTNYVFV